jgi:hypothetical protein
MGGGEAVSLMRLLIQEKEKKLTEEKHKKEEEG